VRHELTVHAAGSEPERRAIALATTAGGSRADGLFLAGAPPAAARLVPAASGVIVEAGATGVRVGGHAVSPGSRRLLRPGERAEIQGAALALERASSSDGATRAAAAALLREAASGADPVGGPRLVVLTGVAAGDRHALAADQTVGRGRAATIRIADSRASRVHARVRIAPGGATIEDLRSKNGLRVNGVRVDGPTPLRPGDEVGIGETLLAFEDAEPPPDPTAEPGGSPSDPARRPRARRIPAHAAAAALLALSAVALALAEFVPVTVP
jgi:FHA domain